MQVQLIRNATLRIRGGGRTLLIDPYLADVHAGFSYAGTHKSPLAPLPLPIDELLAGLDAVFVSHLHSDHFDATARERLPKSLPILCPAPLEARLREFGFSEIVPIDDRLDWFDLGLQLTGGRHGPDDVLAAMGPVNGLVLALRGGPRVYCAGDTIWCPEVRAAIDVHDPQAIVVHACGATWKGVGPLVMDEAQVEAVLGHATAARVIAVHLDCVDHATVTRASLLRHFDDKPELRARLDVPADGGVVTVE